MKERRGVRGKMERKGNGERGGGREGGRGKEGQGRGQQIKFSYLEKKYDTEFTRFHRGMYV